MPTATAAANSISSGDSVDARSGYCTATRSFRSLRPPVPLPPPEAPLSFPAFALLLLPYSLPAHPALLDAATGEAVSFPAFVSQARALAAALRSRAGFARGDVAFVLAPARLDVPVLYFALLSISAVVAPANPALTTDEVARLVALSGASVAFAVASTAAKLPAGVPAVLLDSVLFRSFFLHHPDDEDLAVVVRQSDSAAIQFSSGTTGRLEAAALPHRSFIAMTAGFHALFEKPTPGRERLLLSAPMFHSMGFSFALKAVATGQTMVLVTDAVARAGVKGVLAAAEWWGVVEITAAPPVVTAMAKDRRNLGSLQRVISGGGDVPTALPQL
jgi:4-coumarate--CoA ligase